MFAVSGSGFRSHRSGTERHAVRRRGVGRAAEPAAGRPCHGDAQLGDRAARGGVRRQHVVGPGRLDRQLRVDVWRRRQRDRSDGEPHVHRRRAPTPPKLTVTDNQGATGTTTNAITVTPGATAPAAPSNLSGSVDPDRLVTLNWTDNSSNETGFYVERAAKARNLQFSRIATVGANVKTYSQTETSGQWVYRVQAYNGVGTSGYSNSATIRVR